MFSNVLGYFSFYLLPLREIFIKLPLRMQRMQRETFITSIKTVPLVR